MEVLTQRDEDVMGLTEIVGGSELQVVEGQGHGEVEAVICGFVGHDEHVLVHREIVQVDLVFGGRDQVALLAQFCLPGDLVE